MKNIKQIGGEFALIERIAKKPRNKNVLLGIGDDAAVIKPGKKLTVVTTDTFVEGDHFNLAWSKPKQVGIKAIEANVSDIAAMGALPKYALISLVLKKNSSLKFVDELYKGIYSSCRKYGIDVIGGDTTHGRQLVVNATLIGEVEKKNLCLRSHAKPGDLIMVSGPLGKSTAGLNLFLKKKKGFLAIKKSHLEPRAQLKKALVLAPFVNAMEDVSDGLASEVRNICNKSKVGALIHANKIPITEETFNAAGVVCKDALDYALFGGEDFELVFTVRKKNMGKVNGFVVGEITKKRKIILQNGKNRKELKKFGYDHFA